MKLTLYSFCKSGNIGDLLIAEKLKKIFSNNFEVTLCDLSGQVIDKPMLVTPTKNKNLKLKGFLLNFALVRFLRNKILKSKQNKVNAIVSSASNSELAVFAGGNMLMQLDNKDDSLQILYEAISVLKKQGKRVCFCFVGVGPFYSNRAINQLKQLVSLVDFISVRDDGSFNLIKKYCKLNVPIWRDPVLLEKNNISKKGQAIGINAFLGFEKKDRKKILNFYINIINLLRNEYKDREIILFSSEVNDYEDLISLKSNFAEDSKIKLVKVESYDELLMVYENLSCVVATRMHTIITSIISDIPAIAVVWQQKVQDLMNFLHIENQTKNFNNEEDVARIYSVIKECILCGKVNNKTKQILENNKNMMHEQFSEFVTKYRG